MMCQSVAAIAMFKEGAYQCSLSSPGKIIYARKTLEECECIPWGAWQGPSVMLIQESACQSRTTGVRQDFYYFIVDDLNEALYGGWFNIA